MCRPRPNHLGAQNMYNKKYLDYIIMCFFVIFQLKSKFGPLLYDYEPNIAWTQSQETACLAAVFPTGF